MSKSKKNAKKGAPTTATTKVEAEDAKPIIRAIRVLCF